MIYLNCSMTGTPELDRAGEFLLINPVFDFTYRSPTHALHIYEYDGQMKMSSDVIKFRAGDVTCTPAGVITAYQTATPGRHWSIHFNSPHSDEDAVFQIPCHIPLGSNNLFLLEQFKLICRLFNTPSADAQRDIMFKAESACRLKALLLSLHNISFSKRRGMRSRSTFVWEELLQLIDDNLNRPVSTPWLAEKMNISSGTLSQKFQKEYGCSVSQYLLKKRIDKAKSLLTTTTLTIYEVGEAVGISDPQYFNKQFRKMTGLSPSCYRDENKEYLVRPAEELSSKGGLWRSAPAN